MPHPARSRQPIPTLVPSDHAAALISLLDALSAGQPANVSGLIQYHDDDGLLIAAARAWCGSRCFALAESRSHLDSGEAWTKYTVEIGNSSVVIHDARSHVTAPAVHSALSDWRPHDPGTESDEDRAARERMGAGHA